MPCTNPSRLGGVFQAPVIALKTKGPQDSIGGMIDVHDRRPVVLESADAWRWMNPETSVEEAAHIAQTKSLPTEAFMRWKVDKAVNVADLNNNGKQLLAPV